MPDGVGGRRMTKEEAAMIIKNLKNYLRNEDKLKDKGLPEDAYAALDMALKALDEMPYMFTKEAK